MDSSQFQRLTGTFPAKGTCKKVFQASAVCVCVRAHPARTAGRPDCQQAARREKVTVRRFFQQEVSERASLCWRRGRASRPGALTHCFTRTSGEFPLSGGRIFHFAPLINCKCCGYFCPEFDGTVQFVDFQKPFADAQQTHRDARQRGRPPMRENMTLAILFESQI